MSIEFAAELIADADALVIAAGAGMGVDSGLPDFRGNEGFWRAYPALAGAQLNFIDVASPKAFQDNARLAWGFYGHRLGLYRETVPHAGFAVLRRWGQRMPRGVFVFTSNVDEQFQCAGFDPAQVFECHGSIHWLQCAQPCGPQVWHAGALQTSVDQAACQWRGDLPACTHCGALARPNVLLFGDGRWQSARYDAQEARLHAWLRGAQRPVVVELGAGTHVPSVRVFSEVLLDRHRARLVRINPRECQVPGGAAIGLGVGALEGLRAIDACLNA